MRSKGKFTRARVRKLARQQGYYVASPAKGTPTNLFAKVYVWGWREEDQQIIGCWFILCREHPNGHCPFPPVSQNVWVQGVRANQLGLGLDWEGTGNT